MKLRFFVAFLLMPVLAWANISSQTARTGPVLISGSPQVVPVGFPFQQGSDLVVVDIGTVAVPHAPVTLTLGSDYTVSGGGYNNQTQMQLGSLTVVAGGANAVQTNDQLVILRNVPVNQITSFTPTGPLTMSLVEKALDKQATLSQELLELSVRSLRFSAGETLDGTLVKAQRASRLLGFDSLGAIQYYDPSAGTFVSGSALSLSNIASLKALTVGGYVTGQQASVSGYYTSGDGGGGLFYYNSGSATADNGGTVIAPNAGSGRWLRVVAPQTSDVRWFGAKGDGVTNDTTAIQAAATYLSSGGDLHVPPGTYITTVSIKLFSGTVMRGDGWTSLIKASASWPVPSSNDPAIATGYALIANQNFNAGVITDNKITVQDMAFSYANLINVAGGGTHAVRLRKCDQTKVLNCSFIYGNNGTAMLGCTNTLVDQCFSTEIENAGYDHWEGSVGCTVSNSYVRAAAAYGNQGILFTGADTNLNPGLAYDVNFIGNRVENFDTLNASGILINANNGTSQAMRISVVGNIVKNCSIGIAVAGDSGQGVISSNVIQACGVNPSIFLNVENADNPIGVVMSSNVAVNPNVSVGNIAVFAAVGSHHSVTNNIITTGTYLYGVRLSGDDLHADGNIFADGSGGRYNTGSSTNYTIRDTRPNGTLLTQASKGVNDRGPALVLTNNGTLTESDVVVVCNKATPITVTLPASPVDGQRYRIASVGAGATTVDGNGHNINAAATMNLAAYKSAQFEYIAVYGYWQTFATNN